MLGRFIDTIRQILGIPAQIDVQRPREPVPFVATLSNASLVDDNLEIAEVLHNIRPDTSVSDYQKQIKNPIASRMIAIYAEIEMPDLGTNMVFDTRVDNPLGLSPSLRGLPDEGTDSPWPRAPQDPSTGQGAAAIKGHAGSSCPGYLTKAVFTVNKEVQIPVEILAFHVEGQNAEGRYSVTMYSEVFGQVTAKPEEEKAQLNMWGKMMITFRPDDPKKFGGHEVIQLVSQDYVRQEGTITGFPPKSDGEYITSKGGEVYVGVNSGQRHLRAILKTGRIIFSTDVDEFLQARTRIKSFTLLDKDNNPLDAGTPPYDPALIGKINAVKIDWSDVRTTDNGVTHYRLYRIDPDFPGDVELLAEITGATEYIDKEYDGTRSFTYAVVPAFVDQVGMEVQGVSLDQSMVMALEPREAQFSRRNFGVGHIRWMK